MVVPPSLGALLSRWPSLDSLPLVCILAGSHVAASALFPSNIKVGRSGVAQYIAAALVCLTVTINYAATARLVDNIMSSVVLPSAVMFRTCCLFSKVVRNMLIFIFHISRPSTPNQSSWLVGNPNPCAYQGPGSHFSARSSLCGECEPEAERKGKGGRRTTVDCVFQPKRRGVRTDPRLSRGICQRTPSKHPGVQLQVS